MVPVAIKQKLAIFLSHYHDCGDLKILRLRTLTSKLWCTLDLPINYLM